MFKSNLTIALAVVAGAIISNPVSGQSISDFSRDNICDAKTGKINRIKLLNLIVKKFTSEQIDVDGDGSDEYEEKVAKVFDAGTFSFFIANLPLLRDKFSIKDRAGKDLSFEGIGQFFEKNNQRYTARCLNWKPKGTTKEVTKKGSVRKFTEAITQKIVIRKSTSSLSVPLAKGDHATFSFTRDRLARDSIHQTEIVVGFDLPTFNFGAVRNFAKFPDRYFSGVGGKFVPYFRYNGRFSTKSRAQDVDNLAIGLSGDIYNIPLASFLKNQLILTGEFLSDHKGKSKIANGTLTWRPTLSATDLPFDPIGQFAEFWTNGPKVYIDPQGKLLFGKVFKNGGNATLAKTKEFLRIGVKVKTKLSFENYEALKGLNLHANYSYFKTLKGQIGQFQRIEAGLSYDFDKNWGIGFTYIDGRDEDKLVKLKQFLVNVKFRFGELGS